jgi:membrane-associated phospholipid phosphatase
MRVRQLGLPAQFMRMGCAIAILCLMGSACAFSASSVNSLSAAPEFSPIQTIPRFEQGPIDWRAFAPYAQHEQQGASAFPATIARGVKVGVFAVPAPSWASESDQTESATPRASVDEERPIDWKTIVPDIVHDQRAIWTFPTRLARGEDWKPTLGFLFVLGALISLDSRDTPYFHQTTAYSGYNSVFTATNATVGTLLVPAALYAVGRIRKDSYATHTSLLAGEAIVDSEILAGVLKVATGRRRPYAIPNGGNYADTWFETYHPFPNLNGTFPSGHTIMAFAVATVIAHRYRDHRWAPWVAYGAASLVGFSRLTQQAHFPSDVFAGAAFGYVISRFVVLPGRDSEY